MLKYKVFHIHEYSQISLSFEVLWVLYSLSQTPLPDAASRTVKWTHASANRTSSCQRHITLKHKCPIRPHKSSQPCPRGVAATMSSFALFPPQAAYPLKMHRR